MERFEGVDDGVRWTGVRYELRREDRDAARSGA
jgi:hypothetical protein